MNDLQWLLNLNQQTRVAKETHLKTFLASMQLIIVELTEKKIGKFCKHNENKRKLWTEENNGKLFHLSSIHLHCYAGFE